MALKHGIQHSSGFRHLTGRCVSAPLYLMELGGTGVDFEPTGRVVVISNSVLFQAATPLFKQIPGSEYTWHEVAVPLASNANYKLVQEKILNAVSAVYARYRDAIERELSSIERHIEMPLKAPVHQTKLPFADNGLEFMVRYPVHIRQASDIDDKVTKAVLGVINYEPEHPRLICAKRADPWLLVTAVTEMA